MLKSGDVIENPISGKKIIFLKTSQDTNGEFLKYEMYEKSGSVKDLFHIHPYAEESFTVVSGTLKVFINGEEKEYKEGDSIVIPAGALHDGWNSGSEELHIIGKIAPALRFEDMYAVNFGLVADGKCNEAGAPSLLQIAVTMDYLKDHTCYPGNKVIQRIMLKILAIIGRMLGYKALYKKYNGKDE